MKKKFKKVTAIFIMVIMVVSSLAMSVYADALTGYSVNATRQKAIGRMNTMSSVSWTPDVTYTYFKKIEDAIANTKAVKLEKGKKYAGIPYSQMYRQSSKTPTPYLLVKATYASGGKSYPTVKGVDCASAVAYAWRYANGTIADADMFMKMKKNGTENKVYTTTAMLKDATSIKSLTYTKNGNNYTVGNYISLVGDYGSYPAETCNASSTLDLVNKAGNTIHDKIYSKIIPGDAILWVSSLDGGGGHVQMVTDVNINATNPANSSVTCVDQYGTYDTLNNNSPNTLSSWRTKTYTFSQLKSNNYIPIRMIGID